MARARPMISTTTLRKHALTACLLVVCIVQVAATSVLGLTKTHQRSQTAPGRSTYSRRATKSKRSSTAVRSSRKSAHSTASRRRHHGRAENLHARSAHAPGGKHVQKHVAVAPEPLVEPSGYGNQAKIYSLYDQGVNARLLGDYHTAVSRLAEATEMLKESHLSPTLECMAEFELGQAAEADGQSKVAINSYSRCLYLSPQYTNASVKLASLLLRSGQPALALVRARDAVQRNPNDAGAHMVLSLVLEKNGFAHDATLERDRAQQLLNGVGKVPEPAPRIETVPTTPPVVAPEEEAKPRSAPEPGAEPGNELPKNNSSPGPGSTTSGSSVVPEHASPPATNSVVP